MDGTRIRLLGPVDLLRDGVPDDVPGRSLRTLLAILSLRIDEVVSRDQLVEALYGRQNRSTETPSIRRSVRRGGRFAFSSLSGSRPGGIPSSAYEVKALKNPGANRTPRDSNA